MNKVARLYTIEEIFEVTTSTKLRNNRHKIVLKL